MAVERKKSIIIIGGGPSAMMLACTLDSEKFDVTIIEKGKAIGRKFLVAGKGGFNLTHSEDITEMIQKYDGSQLLIDALKSFTNTDLRQWLQSIGIETYVGSSKRVFPIKGIKPIEVLQAITQELKRKGVTIITETKWDGDFIVNGSIKLIQKENRIAIMADKVVFAMGGGSWKVTGSDGSWLDYFINNEIATLPFRPSNCMMHIDWSESMKVHFGKPIKNIALTYQNKSIKGELMITEHGIEGSPAYALSYDVGKQLDEKKNIKILVDLKPTLSLTKVKSILSGSKKKTSKTLREELSLSSTGVALIKSITSREEFSDASLLAQKIKMLPLIITGLGALDEAISTVGGINPSALNSNMELINYPNHYAIGEMIDWNGPTGGYLLQGCFSMGKYLGDILNGN